ncbi:MAG TPA: ferrous iron transport protein B [Desulfomonilaceae bacterium]|nr:ferrous iron transport protein B [Desulfomonilaceae bacterium]
MTEKITVALAGNPNAGKTTLFNALTGARQHVGNWPGVTVEKKEGTLRHKDLEIHVVDLPGTYSLTAYSLEEIIARTYIVESNPDVVVDVADAANLERNLYLAVQLLEMGVKMVIALNMIDVAEGRNIHIDVKKLSKLLGVPVVATNGKKRIGIEDLLDKAIDEAGKLPTKEVRIQYGTEIEEEIGKIEKKLASTNGDFGRLSSRWLAMKLLEGDADISRKCEGSNGREALFKQIEQSRNHLQDIFDDSPEILLTDARYGFISGALKQCVHVESTDRVHLSESIDTVLTNRLLGPAVLLVVLYLVYTFTFQGSDPFVQGLDMVFKWLGGLVAAALPEGLFKSLVVSGIIDGVGGVLKFTPLIAFMFFAIALLEDTGYMARIAFMLDRVLRGFGLHGASMLALMVAGGLAGGCAVPGIMATRTMKEPKERLVTILVSPLMNCGAKLPVYALLIGAFFPDHKVRMMFILTIISWVMVLAAGKVIRSTVLSGPPAPFVLELPPYRVPTMRGLLIHTWERTWMFVKKAGTVLLAVSIVLWAMMSFPSLPEEKAKPFEEKEAALTSAFLAEPAIAPAFKSEKDVTDFEEFRKRFEEGDPQELEKLNPLFFGLAKAVKDAENGASKKVASPESAAAAAFIRYSAEKAAIEGEKQSTRLKNTIGGRIGVALETVFKPMGFDWRTNVALLGGFAAKEVIVATLGTAYSLGEVETRKADNLSEQLRREPGWNRLTAFSLLLFVMLYNPCIATLVTIRKESGKWRWTLFAMVYTTVLAYVVTLSVYSVGSFLKLGIT